MKTTSERWMRVQTLFNHATELEDGARDSFLTESCADDTELRAEIDELLAADRSFQSRPAMTGASLLTHAVGRAIDSTNRDRRQELVGLIVGSYRLTGVLGHGGAGTVYLGERADRQYSAQVAVKIVENALINDEVARRFQAERQILANLNHPHISRLLDAGETLHGQPYLVMEYVHGEPIDKYCDAGTLTVTQRLQLFVKVCAAVQFAHQNLVVHRDLKPGNILVTPDGTPKLLDFGIAKLLDASAQAVAEEAMTRINDRVLTPEYASPEQILGLNITTTSDVYALGIVLYELLTGSRPYQVSAVSQLELERSICLVDPPRPSQMLALPKHPGTQRTINLDAVANARGVSGKRLKSLLEGDLDAICMRALRKESELRYSSVEQLVEDIQRHLEQQPVTARQGNWVYYTKRFIHRHTAGVVASAAAIAALAGFAVIMSIQAQRIATQRDRANREKAVSESVSNFMVEVFTSADPFTTQGHEVTAKELLDKAGQRISSDLNQQPAVRARLLEAIGSAYRRQGEATTSIKFLEDAVKLQRSLPNNQLGLAGALVSYGKALARRNEVAKAKQIYQEAEQLITDSGQKKSQLHLTLLTNQGELAQINGDLDEAAKHYSEQLALAKDLYGNTHPETALALMSLGFLNLDRGNPKESEIQLREAIAINEATLPAGHPDGLTARQYLVHALYRQNRLTEARDLIEKVAKETAAVFGDDNSNMSLVLDLLSQIQQAQHEWAAAEKTQRRALKIAEKSKAVIGTASTRTGLADILTRERKFAEAEREIDQAIKDFGSVFASDNYFITSAEYFQASIYVETGRPKKAVASLQDSISRMHEAKQEEWRIARSESLLGYALLKLNKQAEAGPLLKHAYSALSASNSSAPQQYIDLAHERLQEYERLTTH